MKKNRATPKMKTLNFTKGARVSVDLSNTRTLRPMGWKSDGGIASFGVEDEGGLALMPRTSEDKRMRMWTNEESTYVIKAFNGGKSIYGIRKLMGKEISMRAIALHLKNEWNVQGLDKYLK